MNTRSNRPERTSSTASRPLSTASQLTPNCSQHMPSTARFSAMSSTISTRIFRVGARRALDMAASPGAGL